MFEYLEPEANDNQETQGTNPGTGSLPLSSRAGGNDQGTRSLKPLNPEKVRHMLFGSLAGIDRTIKILHALGYANPNDWSEPMPAPLSGVVGTASPEGMPRSSSGVETRSSSGVETWMVILTKTLLIA
ncbi:hypothetical protein C8255_25400 [filamentous cyanobacterium CCP3]|nr:hypothetical protein C8255_25400 [filamentous cyanobacterium CCP3]